ncbi:restriction endonuclease subunit S [uncultured Haemophilus sp.]|uniref:restriction endonuclease subunit S n=1 Tax=uncultured Haemophilus sp. TaxID=237779 RepID=UPI0025F580A4|nr:restriction endonuclease subunit S [uncultured Haemophilus sp.]
MKNNRTFLEKLLDGAEVKWIPLGDVADYEQPTKYLVNSTVYNDNYPIPVLTAGKTFILGYTNEDEGIYFASKSPVIIFDDFTTANKWVDFDFKAKSSAMKMITSKNEKFALLKYIYYWLNTLPNNQIDGDHKRQWISNYANKLIPIPPLSVQTEIVRILDALTALTSELTSELTLRRKQYEYYRETLLSPDNLEQLNTGGAKKKLSDVVNIYLGLTYTPTYVENGVKFISAQNTSNDFLDLSNTKFISREEFEKSTSNAKPKRGDILFTRVGSNLGHPVIVDTDEDLCIFVSLGFLRVKDKNILNSYIKHWMNTNLFWKQVEKNVHGSAKVNLNTGWLKNFEIYIPTLKEQQRIVSILDKFETLTSSITEGLPLAIEQSQKRYEYYRELLLNFS